MAKELIMCPFQLGEPCVEHGEIRMRNGEPTLVKCRFWINIMGQNPQTGETVNNYDCAMAWMPVLMIENSKVNRETGAAVESMRNETVKASDNLVRTIQDAATKSQLRQAHQPILIKEDEQ